MCISLWFVAGCSNGDEPAPFDCNTSDLTINVVDVDPETCTSTGSIEISGSGGTGAYLFALDNGDFQESGSYANVVSGTHVAKVKDENGCIIQQDVDLTSSQSTAVITNVTLQTSGCKTSGGSITITATGAGALSYSIDNISFVNTTGVFINLAAGTYAVFVKDADQCIDSESSIKITTGVSLTSDVKPIIEAKCAISNCHNGSQSPNLTEDKGIIDNAQRIKSATQSGLMPKVGTISETQKTLIACWVDDGAKSN